MDSPIAVDTFFYTPSTPKANKRGSTFNTLSRVVALHRRSTYESTRVIGIPLDALVNASSDDMLAGLADVMRIHPNFITVGDLRVPVKSSIAMAVGSREEG